MKMLEDIIREKIEFLVKSSCSKLDFELVECNIKRRNKDIAIQVIADRKNGGITVDDCTSINKLLDRKLEDSDIVGDNYIIEVCSPGLDRPLKTLNDFVRVVGRSVKFELTDYINNRKNIIGVICKIEDNNIIIDTKSELISLPLDKITRAIQLV